MDNVDRECKRDDGYLVRDENIRKNGFLQEDARESFFQLENLVFHLDAKAFGMVAINAIFITMSSYLFDQTHELMWKMISIIFIISIFFMLMCIMPRYYDRRHPTAPLNASERQSSEFVAAQMAVDYAHLMDNVLDHIYDEKLQFFLIGSLIAFVGFVLVVVMLLTI